MHKNLKLFYLNYEYPPIGGGGGTTCKILAEEMAKRGHQVYVLTGGIQGNLGISNPLPGLTIERLYTTRKKPDACSKIEQILYLLLATYKFRSRIRQFEPDLVHVFFSFPTGGVLWLHRFFMRQPYVISLLGGDVPGFLPEETDFYHRLIKPFTLGLWRHAAAIVPNSKRLGELARNTLEADYPVITNGVDISLFTPAGRKPSKIIRMVFVGRLVPQKGLDVLLESLGLIKDKLPPWRLTIVGDGALKEQYLNMASRYALSENIAWLGWVSLEKLPEIYNNHDIFVLPSRYEGMPSVVVQAMACGCAVLACNVYGVDELVTDGNTGRIAKIDDPEDLAEKLLHMSVFDDLSNMGQHGATKAQDYSSSAIASQYESLYFKSMKKLL